MPSIKSGKTIWMSTNVAFSNRYYGPVVPNNGMNLTYTKKFFGLMNGMEKDGLKMNFEMAILL